MAPPAAPTAAANGGVLPVPAAVLQKSTSGTPRGSSNKSSAPRLKVVVRRLPPGLTQLEFETALGEEWKLGGGKVDWFVYKPGKISRDLAKPSRPSRAYLRLADQSLLNPLADKVRQTPFTDAKNTTRDPALIGPPSLEFAPYPRVPGGRRRNDARQGMIDQDPEFKDFLESLTNPVTKPVPTDVTADTGAKEKQEVKTTPLIEHLREKKLAKEKPQPVKIQTKQHARGESKEEKAASKGGDKKSGRNAAKDTTANAEKPGKQSKAEAKKAKEAAAKEAVKILNKEAAAKQAASSTTENNKPTPSGPAAERKRERGNVNIAKQMLQRDLGIGPATAGKRGRRDTASQEAAKSADAASPKEPATPSPAPATAPKASQADNRSPKKDSRPTRSERRAAGKAKAEAAAAAAAAAEPNKPAAAPTPPTGPKILKKPQQPAAQPSAPAQSEKATPPPTTTPSTGKPTPAAPRAQAARQAAAAPTPAPTSKQAFLKHANASQGITEPLIEAALSAFGPIDKVEIDKRKGFAYVDFADPSGLQKAIAASPVKVAEGAVQVLERKDKATPQRGPRGPSVPGPQGPQGPQGQAVRGGSAAFRGGRGRGQRGGGGGAAAAAAAAAGAGSATATAGAGAAAAAPTAPTAPAAAPAAPTAAPAAAPAPAPAPATDAPS